MLPIVEQTSINEKADFETLIKGVDNEKKQSTYLFDFSVDFFDNCPF